jgi:hypothetical protein
VLSEIVTEGIRPTFGGADNKEIWQRHEANLGAEGCDSVWRRFEKRLVDEQKWASFLFPAALANTANAVIRRGDHFG